MCGVLRASWVPTDYPPLCAIQLAPHMVDDHWGRSYLGALKAAKAARTAAEPPPRWVPFDEAPPSCACCGAHFSWESTFQSSAQQVNARHHCRRCGMVVCDGCSRQRVKELWRLVLRGGERPA